VLTTRGARLVSHAGLGMLAEVADLSGLTAGLNSMFVREGCQWRRHPPGVTLIRAAAAIADGMTNLSQVASLCRSRPLMFQRASSLSTLSRTVFTLGNELMTPRLDTVLCDARTRVWAAAKFAPDALIIDVDSTLLTNHSDKQWSAPTYKGGFGGHPIAMFLDDTNEPLP
jgi:Transposase DDE domain group 1